VQWSNERPLENKELNAIIGAWFTLCSDPKRNFVPTTVATKSGQVSVNAAKQSSPRAAVSISTARAVNTAAPKSKVNDALPTTYYYFKSHSPEMLLTITPKTVDHTCLKDLTMLIYKADSSHGYSRHMTGNKSFLLDYQEIDGGFVAFGGSPKRGKITRKGKIRTGKLDFEDVYFVKEIKFNLFSVSQMCDKKNSVLFTKTECLILSPDFKLLDESQVLLRVPKQNNMYSFDLKNVVPTGGRKPALSFMRPFGCPVTILNTLDHLGKFDGKSDDGVFVGYSNNSKAFRVFNTRTRFIEENLHINFLENKLNVVGTGPNWMFDIETLTMSMNYQPVFVGNQTNGNAGTKANIDEGQGGMQTVPGLQYVLLPFLTSDSQSPKSSEDEVTDDAGKKNEVLDPAKEDDKSGKGSYNTNNKDANGNSIYRMFTPVNAARSSCDNLGGSISVNATTLPNDDIPTYPLMPDLEDTANLLNTGIFSGAYNDEDMGTEADLNNLETTMNVSPIPTTRIHKDHPKNQIIRDINSATQTRRMTKISKEHAMVSYIKKQRRTNHKDYQNCLFACFLSQIEPKKVTQALTDPSWIEAMQDELLQFRLQKVWRLVDLPKGKHAIGTKWVYRNKKDKRGIVVRNKERLVAQGYTQEEGIDYDEVFAPVAMIEAIRLFLAYASFMGFIVYQMDVKSAFLYGTIEEEVYVCQPPSFEDPQFPNKVYKVEKALYGLHQAPRAWYETLSTYLLENGFRRGTIDKTLFIKKDKGDILLVQVYVDDIIFGTTKKEMMESSSAHTLTLPPPQYLGDILKKFDFVTVKTTSTPIETNKALLKDEEAEDVDVHLYRSMIGSLMYLTASRPDIMFAVCACARFQVTPKVSHLHVVKRIFRYLKGQPKLGLWYPKDSPFNLEAFQIAIMLELQTVVANSTTEAEYVVAANCYGQVLWIQNQMLNYGLNFMNTKIYIDNESTICIVKNPVFHSKTKHIEIRHHFIRDSYEKRLIQVITIHIDQNVADLLTKAFDVDRFQYLTASIGMLNP
ncbi:putative ribonuclease H-like domain-containing protein, partial [Tanacetum coccineum]